MWWDRKPHLSDAKGSPPHPCMHVDGWRSWPEAMGSGVWELGLSETQTQSFSYSALSPAGSSLWKGKSDPDKFGSGRLGTVST